MLVKLGSQGPRESGTAPSASRLRLLAGPSTRASAQNNAVSRALDSVFFRRSASEAAGGIVETGNRVATRSSSPRRAAD